MGVGEGGIEVCHFYELAARILKEAVEYENRDSEYYDAVAQTARDAVAENLHDLGQFDAILVDEGQDFDDDMLKTVSGLLASEGELVIALDAFQDLYRRKSTWKSLGVDVRGRIHSFNNVYRNTAEIFEKNKKPEKLIPLLLLYLPEPKQPYKILHVQNILPYPYLLELDKLQY